MARLAFKEADILLGRWWRLKTERKGECVSGLRSSVTQLWLLMALNVSPHLPDTTISECLLTHLKKKIYLKCESMSVACLYPLPPEWRINQLL